MTKPGIAPRSLANETSKLTITLFCQKRGEENELLFLVLIFIFQLCFRPFYFNEKGVAQPGAST